MYHLLKVFLQRILRILNLGLVRNSELAELRIIEMKQEALDIDFQFAQILNRESIAKYSRARANSTSALRQDLFALLVSNFQSGGFFLEFGACDGLFVSNSLQLERSFAWSGILAEPGRIWHDKLRKNRNCTIDFRCVWSESADLILFTEFEAPGLSSAVKVDSNSYRSVIPKLRKEYIVETISLKDLLVEHNAPREINFMSLDTEGSEFEILKEFPFSEYIFKAICCEHNFTDNRNHVQKLLAKNGYHHVLPEISKYDDWFVHERYLSEFSKHFVDPLQISAG
jgi:FkbM family methyltransferase